MKVERFEDLIAWQKARELTRHIYSLMSKGLYVKDFAEFLFLINE
jgi:hypothetical protein